MGLKKIFMTGDNNKQGVTLIELLVTITVFSIVITASLSLFASALKEQRKALSSAYLLNTASYVTDYISRALRMAQKDMAGSCIAAKHNFATLQEYQIKFLNSKGKCQEFFLEGGIIKVRKSEISGIPQNLTPANLQVENLKFKITGEGQDDLLQPKVTFIFKLKTKEPEPQTFNLQTTVSQRQLDVPY